MFDNWRSRVTSFYRGAEAAAIVARAQCRAIVKASDAVREYDARPFDFADLQGKPEPAMRLALRAASHLEKYPALCERVRVGTVLGWLQDVGGGRNLVAEGNPPRLELFDT